jgi:hypothetical protein
MWALIAKEWRENRWLVIGFLVLAPILSLTLKWGIIGWKATEPSHSMRFVIPLLGLLYVLMIAADLIASDSAGGRYAFLFTLPVRAFRVWAAKVLFLFGSAAVMLAYLFVLEAFLLFLGDKAPAGMITADALEWSVLLIIVAVVGTATLAFSGLVNRGLAAAILALLVVAGLGFTSSRLLGLNIEERPRGLLYLSLCILTGSGFLIASGFAFCLGRIHLGSTRRRIVLASAAFLVVVGLPGTWAGVETHHWCHPQPHEQDIRILQVEDVDPTGSWALVAVSRPHRPFWMKNSAPPRRWAVHLASGTVRDLTELGFMRNGIDTWTEGPDCIVLHRNQPTSDPKRFTWIRMIYDLEQGKVVSTRPGPTGAVNPFRSIRYGSLVREYISGPSKCRLHREGKPPVEVDGTDFQLQTGTNSEWGVLARRVRRSEGKPGGTSYFMLMLDTGEERPVASALNLLPSSVARDAWLIGYHYENREHYFRIVRVPLDGSPATTVIAAEGLSTRMTNRQSTRALAVLDDRTWWIDANSEEPDLLPEIQVARRDARIKWSNDGLSCLVSDGQDVWRIVGEETGPEVERIGLPPIAVSGDWNGSWFDGERLLLPVENGARLLLFDMDGSSRQILPLGKDTEADTFFQTL